MPHQRVIVASDPRAADRAAWWAAELPHCWPRAGERVTCTCVTLDELATEVALAGTARSEHARPTVVLLIARHQAPARIMQLADKLLGARTAALLLTDETEGLRAELEPHGLVLEHTDTDRVTVARVLHALAARQAAVDTVARELLIARASQGGLTGEISRLHDELQLAGAVQRRFLPRAMPDAAGYDFGVLFRPCGYVSGDLYDVVRFDERHIAVMLADAVGHGVPAALLTLVIGRALRQYDDSGARHPLHSPAETLARLNAELCIENEAGDRFATAVCAVIDTHSHAVTLASAGHPAPMLMGRGQGRAVSGGDGPLLGVFTHAEYTQTTLELSPGETLLLYTDGFETAFPVQGADPRRAQANLAYVGQFARALGDAPADGGGLQHALERVGLEVEAHAGSLHQRDDLTALAIRRLGQDARELDLRSPVRAAA
ncbi:MAG TPA: PP2C family protein-serine/threonine phosphatase [Phycisphaerales bacterium]|nr:PP2C family protein-serine/threonine phosphatase [Phycisphaerales bacterium]